MEWNATLNEILAAMGDAESPPMTPIPQEQVLRWMLSDDVEVLGALYTLLSKQHHFQRINPLLTVSDMHPFTMRYYERCFLENPDGEWSDSRYSAGWDLVNWFAGIWRDKKVQRKILGELKDWLANLYKEGDEELRICLVNATLEHLFENGEIAKYFADWKKDPLLAKAYSDAMLWSEKGGTTPLGKSK